MSRKQYVLGFCFDSGRTHVALMLKNRPEWQAGHLNGIGGKIDYRAVKDGGDEGQPVLAMEREFREETGLVIKDWQRYCVLYGGRVPGAAFAEQRELWAMHCFVAFGDIFKVQTLTDEAIEVVNVARFLRDGLAHKAMANLMWLIPMGLNVLRGDEAALRFGIHEYYTPEFKGQKW